MGEEELQGFSCFGVYRRNCKDFLVLLGEDFLVLGRGIARILLERIFLFWGGGTARIRILLFWRGFSCFGEEELQGFSWERIFLFWGKVLVFWGGGTARIFLFWGGGTANKDFLVLERIFLF